VLLNADKLQLDNAGTIRITAASAAANATAAANPGKITATTTEINTVLNPAAEGNVAFVGGTASGVINAGSIEFPAALAIYSKDLTILGGESAVATATGIGSEMIVTATKVELSGDLTITGGNGTQGAAARKGGAAGLKIAGTDSYLSLAGDLNISSSLSTTLNQGAATFNATVLKVTGVSDWNIDATNGLNFSVNELILEKAADSNVIPTVNLATLTATGGKLPINKISLKGGKFNGGNDPDATIQANVLGTDYTIDTIEVSGSGSTLEGVTIDYSTPATSVALIFDFTDFDKEPANAVMLTVGTDAEIKFDADSQLSADNFVQSSLDYLDTYLTQGGSVTILDGNYSGLNDTIEIPNSIGLVDYVNQITKDGKIAIASQSGDDSYKPYFEGVASVALTIAEASRGLESTVEGLTAEAVADQFLIKAGFLGQSVKNETGSSVDVKQFGYSLAGGRRIETSAGAISFGAFIEGGSGDYTTINSYAGFADKEGDGSTDYFGGGLFLRHDFTGGAWATLSGRIGSVDNDYKVKIPQGTDIEYSASSDYFGLNAGVGYLFEVGESTSIDLYGKFSFTSVKGGTVTDSAGGTLDFDKTTSSRTRIGGRVNHAFTENIAAFFGLAWEQEFNGKTGGTYTINGVSHTPSSADFGGASALGEVGISVSTGEYFSFQLEGFGLVGQSKGGGGLASLVFTF
jgi:hypothetical protein